jgi:hypothetical protein
MACVVTPMFICSACSGLRIHLASQEHADRLALFSVNTTRAPLYVQTVCTVAALLFVAALSITLTANTISRPTLAPLTAYTYSSSCAALSITNCTKLHRVKTCPAFYLRASSDCLKSQSRRRKKPLASTRQSSYIALRL